MAYITTHMIEINLVKILDFYISLKTNILFFSQKITRFPFNLFVSELVTKSQNIQVLI